MNWTEEEYEEYLKKKKNNTSSGTEHWSAEEYRVYMETGEIPNKKKPKSKTSKTNSDDDENKEDKSKKKKKSKYNNEKVTIDGIVFDSIKEGTYYIWLKDRKKRNEILDFELQPKFVLLPAFEKDGKKYRAITYKADFKIINKDGTIEIVDTKGFETNVFRIKRKLFEYMFPDLTLIIV